MSIYRVWSIKQSKFLKNVYLNPEGTMFLLNNGILEKLDKEWNVFQRYTYFKDIQNQKLFEGDIIKWDADYIGDYYEKEGISWIKRVESEGFIMPSCPFYFDDHRYTKIGSIFENPELLKNLSFR